MGGVTTLPTDLSVEMLEDKLRERLKGAKRTSFGSEYLAFHASRDEVVALAQSDMVNTFRRVVLDPVRGLVMLMSPSGGHEITSGDLDRFISSAATLKKIKVDRLGATRWRKENEPKNTGNEADCSFYFAQKAVECREAYARSDAEGDTYTFQAPPDLVVEVGLTHESKEKYLSYRDKGVVEFWQLNARPRKQGRSRVTVTFLDLQTQPKPMEIESSINLPDVTPAHVIRFIRLQSRRLFDHLEVYEAVRSLLEDESGPWEIREEGAEYELER